MRIFVVSSMYPSAGAPHHGQFVQAQARALAMRSHQVVVLNPSLQSIRNLRPATIRQSHFQVSETLDHGVHELRWHGWAEARTTRMAATLGGAALLRTAIDRFGIPDALHAHSSIPSGEAGLTLATRSRLPLVLTEHSSEILSGISNKRLNRIVRVAKSANRVVCVGSALHDRLAMSGVNSIVVPNVVDTELFQIPESVHVRTDLASVGTLIPRKRHDLAISAFSQVRRQGQTLHIIGSGPQERELRELANTLGVEGAVKFHGSLESKEVAEVLSSVHTLLSCSEHETFGVTLAEGLAMGIRVIATDSGGPRDILTDPRLGVIIPRGDAKSLAAAILDAGAEDPGEGSELRRAHALAHYSAAAVGSRLEQIFIDATGL